MKDNNNMNEEDVQRPWLLDNEEPCAQVPEQKEKVKFVTLTELRPQADPVANQGYAYIKRVVRGAEREEIVRVEVIPVTTARLESTKDLIQNERQPKPPMKTKMYGPEHEFGRGLGLTKPTLVEVIMADDPQYAKALEKYQEFATWSLAAEAIDMALYYKPSADQEAVLAVNTSDKVQALRQAGYQSAQVQEILAAAIRIANFTQEERRDFFGGA